jgi:hypothetical protein
MKIYTQLSPGEVEHLSTETLGKRRWSEDASDFKAGVVVASAFVSDDQVDFIGSRHAREDGGLSHEVCLFPGASLTDVEVTVR